MDKEQEKKQQTQWYSVKPEQGFDEPNKTEDNRKQQLPTYEQTKHFNDSRDENEIF